MSDAEGGGVGDGLYGETLIGQGGGDRVVGVFGDEEDAWATGDFDPSFGAIVSGMGVFFGDDLGGVMVGADVADAVGEFNFGDAIDDLDGGAIGSEWLTIAVDAQGDGGVLEAADGDPDDEGFADLGADGEFEAGEVEVVGGCLLYTSDAADE